MCAVAGVDVPCGCTIHSVCEVRTTVAISGCCLLQQAVGSRSRQVPTGIGRNVGALQKGFHVFGSTHTDCTLSGWIATYTPLVCWGRRSMSLCCLGTVHGGLSSMLQWSANTSCAEVRNCTPPLTEGRAAQVSVIRSREPAFSQAQNLK
jgi:hypothetical protein